MVSTYEIRYEEAMAARRELKRQLIAKKQTSELFGNQKDDSFAGLLGNIVQSFGGQYVYATIEEQAAHLFKQPVYVTNHPLLCELLEVNCSSYYDWRKMQPSARTMATQQLKGSNKGPDNFIDLHISLIFLASGLPSINSMRNCARITVK